MDLFRQILSFDSTSGSERELGQWLAAHLEAPFVETFEVGDGTLNVLLRWSGTPRVVFCSHMDTVPPYIPPTFTEDRVLGRGSCDAKGQFYAMYRACQRLAAAGEKDFALLIVSGEETGSWGAKAFSKTGFTAPLLVVGEPTDNCMVSASKGTKRFDLTFIGKAFHSGYPEHGVSAVELFVDFMNALRAAGFPDDPVLGPTTWNVGRLSSDNPQNILSPQLSCRLYFRTTFASDDAVVAWMRAQASDRLRVEEIGGDAPARYFTLPGFPTKPVAFGSDAPHLTGFAQKIICGPGTITVAHRDDEFLSLSDLQQAINNYIKIYESYH
ncbi:MAG: M20/M25/M40 family metallo-hydrolase [Bacteroidales bacterium]|nr:M20/M25/M40 family metallo-hydrolase [Bacteroidales bacterium]MBR6876256.1 M20/M25/M40 family metallo-hydrolase [Bacteroidales bacterium]